MSALRANLADRDVPRNDDTIGFMIDTFNDGRRAFQFRVNPRGVQMDAFNSDVDDSEDWSWDAIWDAKVQLGDDGYTVEIARAVQLASVSEGLGRADVGLHGDARLAAIDGYRMRSTFVDRNRTCLVCQFDKLSGFTAITPGRNLEFDPTADRGSQRHARGCSLDGPARDIGGSPPATSLRVPVCPRGGA